MAHVSIEIEPVITIRLSIEEAGDLMEVLGQEPVGTFTQLYDDLADLVEEAPVADEAEETAQDTDSKDDWGL